MGQEVYRGGPGGGSRAVRDVLCGKDVHSVTTRDRKLQVNLTFVACTKRTVRFDDRETFLDMDYLKEESGFNTHKYFIGCVAACNVDTLIKHCFC